MKTGLVVDLGVMEYGAAWDLQRRIVAARKAGAVPDVLLLCEHPHVITLGRNGQLANLRATDHVLDQMEVSFFETDRGGDITYHGPGQIVGYPIVNLAEIRRRGKTGRHRSASESLGYVARFCLQRVDGFALFRFDRAVRDCRQAGHFSRKIAGAQRENGRSLASDRGAPRRVARSRTAAHAPQRFGYYASDARRPGCSDGVQAV